MAGIDDFFDYLNTILIIINAVLYAWIALKGKQAKAINIFTIYLAANCISQVGQFILAKLVIKNLFLSHFYFLSQFILLSLFYKELLNSKQSKIVNYVLFSVLLILGIQYVINPNLFLEINIFEIFITTFPIIVYSVMHLYNSLSKTYTYKYINTAILLYLTLSALIFILLDYLSSIEKSNVTSNIWFLNKVLYVGFLLLILIEWKVKILPTRNN